MSWLNLSQWSELKGRRVGILVSAGLFFACILVSKIRNYNEINKHSAIVYAKITDRFTKGSCRYGCRYVAIRYAINDTIYNETFENDQDKYSTNDSVIIRCSTKKPYIFDVIGIRISGSDFYDK